MYSCVLIMHCWFLGCLDKALYYLPFSTTQYIFFVLRCLAQDNPSGFEVHSSKRITRFESLWMNRVLLEFELVVSSNGVFMSDSKVDDLHKVGSGCVASSKAAQRQKQKTKQKQQSGSTSRYPILTKYSIDWKPSARSLTPGTVVSGLARD